MHGSIRNVLFLALSAAFVPHRDPSFEVGGGTIEVNLDSDLPQATQDQLMDWVHSAANSVVAYYGRFPLPRTYLNIRSFEGKGVHAGHTFGLHNGGLIRISVGRQTSTSELRSDWMLTHEMIHLTFPSVPEEHHWIEEGIAVYVEPIARMRAGNMSKENAWGEMARDMPQGRPEQDDEGLDHTHTWGRTYWGGAMFCLMADVEIRLRTHNQKGLEDALRAVMNDGGVITEDWELEHALEIADKAVGVPVLKELYSKMKDKPVKVDLDRLWQELGVARKDGRTIFNERAPLAAIREAINTGKAGKAINVKFSLDGLMSGATQ
jgi:predicted metalloprotease with PDZ domain